MAVSTFERDTAAANPCNRRSSSRQSCSPPVLQPLRPQLAVSTAVFRDGKVLLASRMAAPSLGLFSLPGGRVEYGETLEEAALRELDEEVKVRAGIVGFADHVEIRDLDEDGALRFHGFVCVFAARWLSGEPQTGPEAGEIIWADQAAIAALPTTHRLAEVVARAASLL